MAVDTRASSARLWAENTKDTSEAQMMPLATLVRASSGLLVPEQGDLLFIGGYSAKVTRLSRTVFDKDRSGTLRSYSNPRQTETVDEGNILVFTDNLDVASTLPRNSLTGGACSDGRKEETVDAAHLGRRIVDLTLNCYKSSASYLIIRFSGAK